MTSQSKEILGRVQKGDLLTEAEMMSVMREIMNGEWENEQIAALLMGLSMRGETIEEITGAARVMREKALPVKAPSGAVDCCGTGGDKSGTYNISTAVAFVCAACGVAVAKHGNRAASSKSGAADVLEAMGINLDVAHEKLEIALEKFNFAFLMAPQHHAAMRYVVPVRKKMGVRTMFNVLGPLANPAGTEFQLLGVFDESLLEPIAQVLRNLGTKRAWVVHGSDGLDEITTTGITKVAILDGGEITLKELSPKDFGVAQSCAQDLIGGDAQVNAQAMRAVFSGEKNAYRDIVVANAAAVLVISGKAQDLTVASEVVQNALDQGGVLKTYEAYRDYTCAKA